MGQALAPDALRLRLQMLLQVLLLLQKLLLLLRVLLQVLLRLLLLPLVLLLHYDGDSKPARRRRSGARSDGRPMRASGR